MMTSQLALTGVSPSHGSVNKNLRKPANSKGSLMPLRKSSRYAVEHTSSASSSGWQNKM